MQNFNLPYLSRSIPEFWRRWHISLMTWFRDYIYIPLGGSRCSKWKVIRNTIIVFGISGLWHGANWTFICWGLYHACLIALYIMIGINTKAKDIIARGELFPSAKDFSQMFITFTLVTIGWIIFRAESIHDAANYISLIFDRSITDIPNNLDNLKDLNLLAITRVIIILIIAEWLQRDKQHALQFTGSVFSQHRWLRWGLYYLIIILIAKNIGDEQTFIYFQF